MGQTSMCAGFFMMMVLLLLHLRVSLLVRVMAAAYFRYLRHGLFPRRNENSDRIVLVSRFASQMKELVGVSLH